MLLTGKGMADPPSQTITFYGEMDEPMLNVSGRIVKYVTRVINENKHVFEIVDLYAGAIARSWKSLARARIRQARHTLSNTASAGDSRRGFVVLSAISAEQEKSCGVSLAD